MNRWILAFIVLLLFCLLIAFAGIVALDKVRDLTAVESTPVVDVLSPRTDDLLTTDEPIMLQAAARDPDGVVSIEFWLDNTLLRMEESPWHQGITPLPLAHAVRIEQAGQHNLVVRAFDTLGNSGQASMVFSVAQGMAAPGSKPYVVQEGDTLEDIAGALEVPIDSLIGLNPGLSGDPAPGDEITLPPPPTEEPDDAEPPAEPPFSPLGPPDIIPDPLEVIPRWLSPVFDLGRPPLELPAGLLEIPLLEVDTAYDGVFCYVSAGDLPVIRTPAAGFLTHLEGNFWDISEWFSGGRMLPFISSTGSLRLRMNCVGFYYTAGGGVAYDLGTLDVTRSISEISTGPVDERTSDSGRWFRVQFWVHPMGEGGGRGGTDYDYLYLDSSRYGEGDRPLAPRPHVLLEFRVIDEGARVPPPTFDGFLIYRNGALWRHATADMESFPAWDHLLEAGGCGDMTEFHVVGYSGDSLAPTATLESNHILVSGYCPPDTRFRNVTVEFEWLKVFCMRWMDNIEPPGVMSGIGIGCGYSGGPECNEAYMLDYEGCPSALDNFGRVSYGGLNVNGREIIEMDDGIIQFTPRLYPFNADPWVRYSRHSLVLTEAESLTISSNLWDWDVFPSDDPICPGAIVLTPEEITEALTRGESTRRVEVLSNEHSSCALAVRITVEPITPPPPVPGP